HCRACHLGRRSGSRPAPLLAGAFPGAASPRRRANPAPPRVLLAMPQLTFPITGAGLAVPVWVGLDGKTTAALHGAGQPIPPPVQARGLLDTCSDVTALASWVLRQLGVPPTTTATTHTAGGVVAVQLFEVSLSI